MFGRSRSEPCGSCGIRILVPPFSSTFYCHSCHTTTRLQGCHAPIRRVRGWLRGMFSNPGFASGSIGSSSSSDYGRLVYGDGVGSAMNWPASFPANRAKKRAVLVGVSYSLKSYQLKGTVNDVKCMRYFLCEKFQFSDDSILVLTGGYKPSPTCNSVHGGKLVPSWDCKSLQASECEYGSLVYSELSNSASSGQRIPCQCTSVGVCMGEPRRGTWFDRDGQLGQQSE